MQLHDSAKERPAIQNEPDKKKEPDEMAASGRRLKIIAGIFVVVLLVGFVIVQRSKMAHEKALENMAVNTASAPPAVDVIAVESAPSSLPLTLPGETAAWYESTIYARVDGYVGKWYSDIGDHVKKGQVLATIETPDLDAQLAAVQAKLKADQSLVAARQADADFAKKTYERWNSSPKGVVSEEERDAKKAGYDSAFAQLAQAQAQLGLDQADVDRYMALTQFKQVVAPYDGTITQRRVDIGNLVTAGSNANTTPLYHMVQDDLIRIFVDVPQNAATDMKVGVPAKITANHIRNRVFDGKITRTADAINPQARTLRVEVDIPNSDHVLVPGMYVDISFQIPETGLVQVPAAALVFRPSGPVVAVVDKDNKISFHKVAIARDNGNVLEIASGISTGDKIALNISNQITSGETVEVHETKEAAVNAPPK
jgi:RND family efflux transporter MFP subunit